MTPSARHSDRGLESKVLGAGIVGLAPAYAGGTLDPAKVVATYLARIAAHDARIGAYVDLDASRAEIDAAASAARWSRGQALSPLDGVPLAIKSNIAVAGLPWTAGIGAYRDRLAPRDAACVAHLRRAGAIILGTVNMAEAALGATTDNPWFGRTRNPYRVDHSAGGSSGGSAAAVAAGLCAAALGTDTFGSVRIPAGYCGLFGYKPAAGALSRHLVVPLVAAFDTVGFLTRSAADCRILADFFALLPETEPAPASVGIFGFSGDLTSMGNRLRRRLSQMDINFREVDISPDLFARAMKPALLIAESQAARVHRDILAQASAEISPRLRSMLEWGRDQSRSTLLRANSTLASCKAEFLAQIAALGPLLCPTTPTVAPPWPGTDDRCTARFTLAASISGLPSVALPFGRNRAGLPLSVQITGQCDRTLLNLAEQIAMPPRQPLRLN